MVDLDPMDDEDVIILKGLLEEHLTTTGSTVANFVLGDLENQKQSFVKVYPRDYKKVIQSKKSIKKVLI
jgi:glutamate synthase (NADPH/NADH) large chain